MRNDCLRKPQSTIRNHQSSIINHQSSILLTKMFPEEFIRRISEQKYIDTDTLLRALREPSPVSIRINPSKWKKKPFNAESVPWCRNGFYLGTRPSYTLDPLFHSGCYYPQEASGMFLEQALKQTAGSLENIRVLDLCGAPGGKSTHLADLIGRDSLLIANEVIRSRAAILAETITKWGTGNAIVTNNDPSVFGQTTPLCFHSAHYRYGFHPSGHKLNS